MINIFIASPVNANYQDTSAQVEIKTTNGVMTLLQNHIPIVSEIKDGYIKYNNKKINIKNGVLNFKNNNLYLTYQ